jgi:hypothetical protein
VLLFNFAIGFIMFCEICDAELTCLISRYRYEPYIDGKYHDEICMLCSTMAEKYNSLLTDYAILTGNIASKEFVMSCGFSSAEYDKVEKILKRFVMPIRCRKKGLVLTSIHFGPTSFLDMGPVRLNIADIPIG